MRGLRCPRASGSHLKKSTNSSRIEQSDLGLVTSNDLHSYAFANRAIDCTFHDVLDGSEWHSARRAGGYFRGKQRRTLRTFVTVRMEPICVKKFPHTP